MCSFHSRDSSSLRSLRRPGVRVSRIMTTVFRNREREFYMAVTKHDNGIHRIALDEQSRYFRDRTLRSAIWVSVGGRFRRDVRPLRSLPYRLDDPQRSAFSWPYPARARDFTSPVPFTASSTRSILSASSSGESCLGERPWLRRSWALPFLLHALVGEFASANHRS